MAQNSQNHEDQKNHNPGNTGCEEDTTQIEGVVPKIKIITNRQYSSKIGVAFAINKDLVDENNLQHEIMIPNEVSQLKVKWVMIKN